MGTTTESELSKKRVVLFSRTESQASGAFLRVRRRVRIRLRDFACAFDNPLLTSSRLQ
jgi:hypothetical protein